MSNVIYASYTQHVNQRYYQIVKSEYYTQQIPDVYITGIPDSDSALTMRDPEMLGSVCGPHFDDPDPENYRSFEPLYSPASPDHVARAYATIAEMTVMAADGVFFAIADDKDAAEILHVCDNYLKENRGLCDLRLDVLHSCHRMLEFRQLYYTKVFRTLLVRRPDFLRAYENAYGANKSIIALLQQINPHGTNINPVAALGIAPVKLPPIPKAGAEPEQYKQMDDLRNILKADSIVPTAQTGTITATPPAPFETFLRG